MRYPSFRALSVVGLLSFMASACAPKDPDADAMAANPCAANPCAANPGGSGLPMIDAAKVTQGDNALYTGDRAQLIAQGKELWSDPKLSSSGSLSCSSCHVNNYGQMQATFASPYPHSVAMAQDRAGVAQVNAAEMVQFCMVVPMNNEPLAWNSRELAALAAYVEDIQKGFTADMASSMNPCAANPCAKNPCAANPCAANPCAKNPCAKNPCAKNPCAKAMPNPCKKGN